MPLATTGQPMGLYEKALPAAWSWERRLAGAAEAGYDFVEMSIDETDERLARLDWSTAQRAALRRHIADTGVRVATICLSGHRKYPLGSRVPEVRTRAGELMRGAIELSLDIGVRVIQISGYDVFYEESDDSTIARFVDELAQSAEWAAQAGVMLALENVDVPMSESIARCVGIVRRIGSPWLQIYPDMANSAAAGYDPVADLRHAEGRLVAMHVKDGLPRVIRRVPFGTGIVHFDPVFRTLAEMNFHGPFIVEMWCDDAGEAEAVETARAARSFVADLVARTYPATALAVAG